MAELRILDEPLPNLFLLQCPHFQDDRGDLSKLFHSDTLIRQGINFAPAEIFLTRSQARVLRGMHYQTGDAAHDKLVSCVRGCVLDVVVDVRPESFYFNKPYHIVLSDSNHTALLIGKGYAHGFLALQEDSWMHYATTTVHSPSLDRGVLWSSIDFGWPLTNPILSLRDSQHEPIGRIR